MLRLVVLFVFILFIAFTQNISAQQWTAEQQEVWKTVQTYNRLFAERRCPSISQVF